MGAVRRNIRTLYNFEPPATDDEIRAAALPPTARSRRRSRRRARTRCRR